MRRPGVHNNAGLVSVDDGRFAVTWDPLKSAEVTGVRISCGVA